MSQYRKLSAAVALVLSSSAFAQVPVIDGTAEGLYGPAVSVQGVQTQFGDSNSGQPLSANGSELDGAFTLVSNGKLYLMLAGNLESNFNKLEIFFDSTAGGQNRLRGDNPDVDFNGLNRMGDDGAGNGLRFDTGFEADFYLTVTGGNPNGGPFQLFSNFATLQTSGGGTGTFLGGSPAGTGALEGALGINIALNNSNTAGVTGGTDASSGAGVTTGIEIEIPLSVIGAPTGNFRISAFINGGGHDFLSNQILGGAPAGTSNLGEPRNVDFAALGGDQFFTVVQATPVVVKGDFGGGESPDGSFNTPDGAFNELDVEGFLLALNDQAGYLVLNPTLGDSLIGRGDFGGGESTDGSFNTPDGAYNELDVEGFLLALNDPAGYAAIQPAPRIAAIPEPAALGLLAPMGLLLARRRR